MTRLRIFFATYLLIMGIPLLAYCIFNPDAPGGIFAFVCAMCAAGIALLYPVRWVE